MLKTVHMRNEVNQLKHFNRKKKTSYWL